MKDFLKGKLATFLVIISTVILAGVAIFTAMRLYQLRQEPVAPNAPTTPKASEGNSKACSMLSFTLTENTPTVTPVVTETPTSTPTTGPTSTPTPTNPPSVPEAPVCTAEKPATPTITSVTRSGTSATITWTKVEKATHYTISYGISSTNQEYGVPNTGNTSSYKIESLNASTKYYFTVYAVNDCMPSNASATVSSVSGASAETLPNSGLSLPTIVTFVTGVAFITFALLLAI